MQSGEAMNCPFFEEKHFRYCKALTKRVMIPSRSEKEEFCCEHYRECPYFVEHSGRKDDRAGTCSHAVPTETTNEKQQ